HDRRALRVRQAAEGAIRRNLLLLAEGQEALPWKAVRGPCPRSDGALRQRKIGVRDHQRGIEIEEVAEAPASRAGATGIVEGEHPGGSGGGAAPARGAGRARPHRLRRRAGPLQKGFAFPRAEGGFERAGEPRTERGGGAGVTVAATVPAVVVADDTILAAT